MRKKLLVIASIDKESELIQVAQDARFPTTFTHGLTDSADSGVCTHIWANWQGLTVIQQKLLANALQQVEGVRCFDIDNDPIPSILEAVDLFRIRPENRAEVLTDLALADSGNDESAAEAVEEAEAVVAGIGEEDSETDEAHEGGPVPQIEPAKRRGRKRKEVVDSGDESDESTA